MEDAKGRHLLYRLLLIGRSPLHGLVNREEYTTNLTNRLNEIWAEKNPFAYCERISVATRPRVDRQARAKTDDYIGDLLRLYDEARDDPDIIGSLVDELRELYEHPRARKYVADHLPQDDALAAVLAEAETLCFDYLAIEDEDED